MASSPGEIWCINSSSNLDDVCLEADELVHSWLQASGNRGDRLPGMLALPVVRKAPVPKDSLLQVTGAGAI